MSGPALCFVYHISKVFALYTSRKYKLKIKYGEDRYII